MSAHRIVHYDPETGEIAQCSETNTIFQLEGKAVGMLADGLPLPRGHFVDLASLVKLDDRLVVVTKLIEPKAL